MGLLSRGYNLRQTRRKKQGLVGGNGRLERVAAHARDVWRPDRRLLQGFPETAGVHRKIPARFPVPRFLWNRERRWRTALNGQRPDMESRLSRWTGVAERRRTAEEARGGSKVGLSL